VCVPPSLRLTRSVWTSKNSEGGFFKCTLEFPKDFPMNPPTMIFQSKMWHPNSESLLSAICSALTRMSLL
jgi:ubiquitin-protein ligase